MSASGWRGRGSRGLVKLPVMDQVIIQLVNSFGSSIDLNNGRVRTSEEQFTSTGGSGRQGKSRVTVGQTSNGLIPVQSTATLKHPKEEGLGLGTA